MFDRVIDGLINSGAKGELIGFTNVDDGDIGIGLGVFKACICLGVDILETKYSCATCGRGPTNYTWMQSGDGAGVFPVVKLFDSVNKTIGALVVLDSPVRSEITIATRLRDSNFSNGTAVFDFELLSAFSTLEGTSYAQLSVINELVFSDARYTGVGECVPIWIDGLTPGEYQVAVFCEPMGHTDSRFEENVLPVDDVTAPRPRVILVMKSNHLSAVNFVEDFSIMDSEKLINTWNQSMVLAYEESFAPETNEINQALAQSKSGADVRMTGIDSQVAANASTVTGLTKSSKLGGLATADTPKTSETSESEVVLPASGAKKFCTECGKQYANESAKFCSECGTSR